MKAILLASVLFSGFLAAQTASATTHTIQVGPNNTQTFSPNDITIALGDTVKWVYGGSDSHTTTSIALGIPAGAAVWDAPLDATHASFTYVPTVVGTYNYFCTPHASMGMIARFVVTFPTSVNNVVAGNDIVLSPNPASGDLRINIGQGASVDLLDLTGRLVRHMQPVSVSATEQQFNVSDIATGTYLLSIRSNGGAVIRKLQIAN